MDMTIMDKTIFNSSLDIFHNSNATGNNSSLQLPLWTTLELTLSIIGILANSLVIIVIMLSSLRISVFMNIVMSLAFFDTIFLLAVASNHLNAFSGIVIGHSLLFCRFIFFTQYVSGIVSSWTCVLISVERYIAIYHPFKVHIYCTKRITFTTMISLTLITSIGLIPFFFTSSMKISDWNQTCVTSAHDAPSMIFICIVRILFCPLPFFFMLYLNIQIIRKFQAQKSFRLRSQGEHYRQKSSVNNSSSLVAMMVSVCLVFAVTSFPSNIFLIVEYSCIFFYDSSCIVGHGWLLEFTLFLDHINHCVNFFLYCLSGSVFRRALFNLFKCKKRKSSTSCMQQQISIAENIV